MSKQCRVVLTPDLAKEIYAYKLELQRPVNFGSCFNSSRLLKGKSSLIAKRYAVSAKTIRDFWSRRTWTFATCSLWRTESISSENDAYLKVSYELYFPLKQFVKHC